MAVRWKQNTETMILQATIRERVSVTLGDWLLIYEIQNNILVLMLYRLGTHSELFKK